jgi:hypothetical protein
LKRNSARQPAFQEQIFFRDYVTAGLGLAYYNHMPKYFSLAITILITSLMLTGPVNNCHAYVIGGSHLLDLMVRNLGSPKTLLVSQKVCIFETEDEPDISESEGEGSDSASYEEIVKFSFPEHFRSDIETDQGVKIHFFSVNSYLTVINGNIISKNEPLLTRYKDVLLFRDRILLENHLSKVGIDTSVSSIGRHNGKIHYVIGAKYPDESLPQLWLDQKNFRPSRYILPDTDNLDNAGCIEIIYLDWKRVNKTWHPERIEIYQGETILQIIESQSIDVNPILTEDIFDINKAELLYKKKIELESKTEEPQDDLHNVRQSIEEFRERFE